MSAQGTASARLKMALNRDEGMKELDQVVLKYGRVEGKPFTFVDHEYQIEIIRDTRSRIAVRKCSQVGLSELMVQKTLAMTAVMQHTRVMFSLPTKEMAMGFSKDRFDGGIEQSDFYSGLVAAGGNSAGQKKIGSCMLYIVGTFGAKSAISVPAEVIISDEVDFSNPTVLGKLNSRLRHANTVDEMGNRGFRFQFSTPTVTGFGIDEPFNKGDQRYYMCRCEHCEKWVLPNYENDFIIPGLVKSISEFNLEDVRSGKYELEKSWIKCPECSRDLFASLATASRRQWVAKRPDVWDHSYQVSPWDVPKYNTPHEIIKQFEDYPLKSDFMNFVIGLPYSDAENTFTTTPEHKARFCTVNMWIFMNCVVQAPTVGGMDIGKTCHLTVKTKIQGGWHVIWMEKIHNTKAEPAAPKVVARFDFYRMIKLCIDAGPDITLVNTLVSAREGIQAVVYVRSIAGFHPVAESKAGEVINADRTKTLTLLLQQHNNGEVFYPHSEEFKDELYQHLESTKKIREKNADGEMVDRFVKSSPQDHWVHSLNYANIAGLAVDMIGDTAPAAAPPMVGGVVLGSKSDVALAKTGENKHPLTGLFTGHKLPGRSRVW